jgi:hypothetical protein
MEGARLNATAGLGSRGSVFIPSPCRPRGVRPPGTASTPGKTPRVDAAPTGPTAQAPPGGRDEDRQASGARFAQVQAARLGQFPPGLLAPLSGRESDFSRARTSSTRPFGFG